MKHLAKTLTFALAAAMAVTATAALVACKDEQTPSEKYTVTYTGGDGATGTAPASAEYEEKATFALPKNTFEKEDYTFTAWSDGTATYAEGATYTMPAHNVTFTAQWVPLPEETGTGTREDPFIWATFAGTRSIELPASTDGGTNYVYIKYTATKDAIYEVSYDDAFSNLFFTLTKEGEVFATANWSLKSASYAFPLDAGSTYILRLSSGAETVETLSITFTEVAFSFPEAARKTWQDAEENPVYTVVIGEKSLTVNGSEVGALKLAPNNEGYTFTWDGKNCTASYVPVSMLNPVECVIFTYGENEEDSVDLYTVGNFPTEEAVGSEENPEPILQSALAKAYDVSLGGRGGYYYTVSAKETKNYTLTTEIDYLHFELTDENGDPVFTWQDSATVKEGVFCLEAGTTYIIYVTDSSNEDGMTFKDVSFTIAEGGELAGDVKIPDSLTGDWVGANGDKLTLTTTTFRTDFASSIIRLTLTGKFTDVQDGDAQTAVTLLSSSGSTYTMVYDKTAKTLTFTVGENSHTLVKSTGVVPAELRGTWTGSASDTAVSVTLGADSVSVTLGADMAAGTVTGFDADTAVLTVSVDGKTVTFQYSASAKTLEAAGLSVGAVTLTRKAETVSYPDALNGTWKGTYNLIVDYEISITIGSTSSVYDGNGERTDPATVTAWDADSKTLTVETEYVEYLLVWDEAAGTLTWDNDGDPVTLTKEGSSQPADEIPPSWKFVWESSDGNFKLDLTGDTIKFTEDTDTWSPKAFTFENDELTFSDGALYETIYIFVMKGDGTLSFYKATKDYDYGPLTKQAETVKYPDELNGTWSGDLPYGRTLVLVLGDTVSLDYGGSGASAGKVKAYNEGTKTLTVTAGGMDWDFVWNGTDTLTYDDDGDAITLKKGEVKGLIPAEICGGYMGEYMGQTASIVLGPNELSLTLGSPMPAGKVTSFDADTGVIVVDFGGGFTVEFTYHADTKTITGDPMEDGEDITFNKMPDLPAGLDGTYVFAVQGGISTFEITGYSVIATGSMQPGVQITATITNCEGNMLTITPGSGEGGAANFLFDAAKGTLTPMDAEGEVVFYRTLDEISVAMQGEWTTNYMEMDLTLTVGADSVESMIFSDPVFKFATEKFFVVEDDNVTYVFEYDAAKGTLTTLYGGEDVLVFHHAS